MWRESSFATCNVCPLSVICNHHLTATDILRQVGTKPYPEFVGCFLTSANHIVYLDWVVFMIYEAGKHSSLTLVYGIPTHCPPVILVLMIIPGIASCKTRKVSSLPLVHKPPFQIGEEGMLVCIISYIETVGFWISLNEVYLNCLQT